MDLNKVFTFLKGNHIWTRIYKPDELTTPIAKAIEATGKSLEKPLIRAIESGKATAKIQLGQGIELSLPISTEIKGEPGEPGKDADEEKIIREVLKRVKLPKPKDGKNADEAKIIREVLKKIEKPSDGMDAVVDYPLVVRETLKEIEKEHPGWKPMTEFEVQEMIRESMPKPGIDFFTARDKKKFVTELKKEVGTQEVKQFSIWQRQPALDIGDLKDVNLSSPTNNQSLTYDSASGKWVNETVSGGSGTPGGSDTQVQFNDGGAFGGITGATTDGTELTLSENLNISDGGIKIPTDNFAYGTPPIKFTHPDMTDAESSKGGIIEWGGIMDGASHAYGLATKAYFDNTSATFTAPSGYKKWAWITTHYDSPVSTGEPIHQHLNLETVKADWDTAITRLQISFGEDIALVSFPNSHVQVYNDKNFYIGTPTNNAYFVFSTSDDRLNVYGKDWNFASAQNVKIGASGAAGAKLHTENASDGTILLVRNTNGSGNNVPMLLLETQTATSRILQGGVQADANKRISILANGQMEWGDGTAARDTNLYRTAADVLKTDDSFVVASKVAIGQTSLDTSKMLSVVTDGTVNGIQARASALGTASTAVLSLETQDVTKRALDFRLTGDSVSRLRLDANASSSGQITFGNGTTADTNLYRSAADTLKTDDALVVGAVLTALSTIEIGNASDTTLARVSAGVASIEGKNIALNGTGEVLTTGTIELGAASDTTISRTGAGAIAVEGVGVALNSVSLPHTASTIELGHASDTTLSRSSAGVLAVEGVVVPTISSTNTLTNKRVTRRLTTINAPGATPSTNTDNVDVMNFTGLGAAITSMTTNLSGTPTDGDLLEFRFLDDGTARGITWGASFASTTVTLPTTTVISTCLRVGFEWRAASSKWECVATC